VADGMDGMRLVASRPHGMLSICQPDCPDRGDKIEREKRDGNKDRRESSMETEGQRHLYKCVCSCT